MGQTDGWHRLAGGLYPQGLSLENVTFRWPGADTDPTSSPETGHLSAGSSRHLANPPAGGPCPLAEHLLWLGGWDTLPLGGGIGPGWREGIWERIGRILLWSHLPSISRRILFAGLLNQSRVHLVMPGRFARCSGARCTSLYEKLL